MALAAYLGNPAGQFGMVKLPDFEPGGAVSTTLTRATSTASLLSGGAVTMRRPNTKRSYSVNLQILTSAEIDTVNSFFTGVQGTGPYCLVDPSWPNQLPANVSTLGAVLGSCPEWAATVGTIAYAGGAGVTVPTLAKQTGLLNWSGAGSGSILYAGLNNVVDGTWLPPAINGLSCEFSIWARTLTSTATVTPALMYGIAGAAPSGTATATVTAPTLSTTFQQLTVQVASNFTWPGTAQYIMPKFTCSTAAAPNIVFAGAEFRYDTTTTAAVLNPWVSGVGVPRVVIPGDVATPVDLVGWREYTLALAEA